MYDEHLRFVTHSSLYTTRRLQSQCTRKSLKMPYNVSFTFEIYRRT